MSCNTISAWCCGECSRFVEVYSSSRSLSKRKVWNLQTFAQGRSDTVFNCTVVFKRAFFVSFRNNWNSQPSSNGCNVHISFSKLSALSPVGPVSRKAGNFLGQEANFDIKTCWIVAQFQAHKLVNFGSLTDSFIVSFSKLLKRWSGMQTTAFRAWKVIGTFRPPGCKSTGNKSLCT